jgi:hypothetical protein
MLLKRVVNTVDSNENISDAISKFMKVSPPTICRPGSVRAVEPTNGSVSNRKEVAFTILNAPITMSTVHKTDISCFFILVSSAAERIKARRITDGSMRKHLEKIEAEIGKSQQQT